MAILWSFWAEQTVPQVRLPHKRTNSRDTPGQMQEYPVEVNWESWGSCWRFNGEWPLCPGSACCDWTSELSFSLWSLQYYGINSSKDCWELSSGWFQGHILLLDWFTLPSGRSTETNVSGSEMAQWETAPLLESWQLTNVVCITSLLELCVLV